MSSVASDDASPPASAALVRAAQAGDREAFAQLYRGFARVVHGIVLARGGVAEAEDLTQQVFLHAFEKLPELRDPVAFPAWLCAMARNVGVDHGRLRRGRPAAVALTDEASSAAPPSEVAAQRDAAQAVLACVRELPDSYRETLVLRLVEGLTGPEIAARTGLTHGSVRVNLTRGMAMLRPLLDQKGLP